MYYEWRALVKAAKNSGLFVHLDTNGIGLRCSEIDKATLRSYVDLLGIPIDGPNSSIHGLVRGQPKHFEIAINRIRWLREIGVTIKINTIVTKMNVSVLQETAELVRLLSPSIWSVYEYWPLAAGGANRAKWNDPRGSLAAAISVLPQYLGEIRVEKNLCHVRRLTYPIVAHDGEVYVHSASDIDEFQSLGSIFDSDVLQRAFALCTGDRAEARKRYDQ